MRLKIHSWLSKYLVIGLFAQQFLLYHCVIITIIRSAHFLLLFLPFYVCFPPSSYSLCIALFFFHLLPFCSSSDSFLFRSFRFSSFFFFIFPLLPFPFLVFIFYFILISSSSLTPFSSLNKFLFLVFPLPLRRRFLYFLTRVDVSENSFETSSLRLVSSGHYAPKYILSW